MESEPAKHTTIIVFGGILLAAVVVALVMYFLPGNEADDTQELQTIDTGEQQVAGPVNFNTAVLERNEYKELDASLFTRGLLPVTPPTGTGKTNVFR